MGQFATKAKQGAEQATQKTEKDGKVVAKSNEAKELIKFMEQKYDELVRPADSFDKFYHGICKMIELFCSQERGQLQYKLPSIDELEAQYRAVRPVDDERKNLTKPEFMKIAENMVKVDSFTFGRATVDVLVVLFGAPMCALLAKRVVPGLKSFSDDVVIPVATSGAVLYLAKANKL